MGEEPEAETPPEERPARIAGDEDATDPEAERLARKDRSIRRRVLLTVTPMVVTLLIPWRQGFAWEMNERIETGAFVVIPLLSLVATVVALLKKRSLLVRSLLLGGLGLSFAWSFHGVIASHTVLSAMGHDFRRLDAYALYVLLGVPIVAFTAELLAALDRRSRLRALVAGLCWSTLVLGYFVPLRSDRIESMLFLLIAEAAEDAQRDPENMLFVLPAVALFFLAFAAAVLTILRLIGDAEQRERWRPRSGCMALVIGTMPAFALLALMSFAAFDRQIEWMGTAIDGAAWTLGFCLGLPSLLAAGLDGLATTTSLAFGSGDPTHVRRARLGIGAVSVMAILWCLTPVALQLLPDDREDRAAEELVLISQAVLDAAFGQEVDPRFVGGYSEFDLRGSLGVLRGATGDATPELVFATYEIVVSGRGVDGTVTVGVDPDASLTYVGAEPRVDSYPARGMLRRASEPLADLSDRITEGLTSITCLPPSAPPSLPGLTPSPEGLTNLCNPTNAPTGERRRIRDIGGDVDATNAGTGRYRVWARAGGAIHRLEGSLYTHEGRLWIGRSSLDPE